MSRSPIQEQVQIAGMDSYNHGLFESMAYFCDAVIAIDLSDNTIQTLHDRMAPLMVGRISPLSAIRDMVLRFMRGAQAEVFISRLNATYLSGLRQSLTFTTGTFFIDDEPHNLQYNMTPEFDGNAQVVKVYVTFFDIQAFMKQNNLVKDHGVEQEELHEHLLAERALYRNALLRGADYSLTTDVDLGLIISEEQAPDGRSLMGQLRISLPADYDAVNRIMVEHFGIEVEKEEYKRVFTCAGLREMYPEPDKGKVISFYSRTKKKHIRLMILMAEDPTTGHLMASTISFDITDEVISTKEKQRTMAEALMAAEQASKAKTVFLNNMSHDIRTPMNAIIGYTSLAVSHLSEKDMVADYLSKIKTSSDHLLALINDILDMSRIESGKMKLDETEVSLPELMNDLQNIVREEMNSKKLELFFDTINVTQEVVWCDKLRLNQILLNCISNAVKYTPAFGSIGIRVIQTPSERPDCAVYIFKVLDTGIGMSADFARHIFEPFSREETSTVSGIQGTGLGMAITKNLVDMLGGTISVVTEKGKGTEFTIRLQLRIAMNGIHQDFIIDSLRDKHALVVTSNPDTCISVTDMLSNMGLRTEWTTSPREALLRCDHARRRNDPYDLYIIDDALSDMSGFELTRTVRKTEGTEPIIILTAYDRAEAEPKALKAGVTTVCTKPLFMSKLHETINRVIENDKTEALDVFESSSMSFDGCSILLVEDNALNQEIAVTLLSECGASVDVADDGRKALETIEAAAEDKYDFVLMNIQMPVMNGYEATKAIRALPGTKGKIPIIAMTANAFKEDKVQALACGMNAHVAKPISMDVLAKTVREVLKK